MIRTAVISPCGLYRYQLTRAWGDGPRLTFVMLNPSTADGEVDDPTIRRCIGYARDRGFGSLVIVNLFAFRATDPKDLKAAASIAVGDENDDWLFLAFYEAVEANQPVIAGWGTHGSFMARDEAVVALAATLDLEFQCLGATKDGHPRHPLYLRSDAPFVAYRKPGCRPLSKPVARAA